MDIEVAWFGIVIFFLIVSLAYVQSYIKRRFTWIKMKEENYLEHASLDIIQVYTRLIVIGLFFFTGIAASRLMPAAYQEPFNILPV